MCVWLVVWWSEGGGRIREEQGVERETEEWGGQGKRGGGEGKTYFCPKHPRVPRLKGMRYLSGLLASTSQRSGRKVRGSGKWRGEIIVERKSMDTGVYFKC